jgi:hypothetical protein
MKIKIPVMRYGDRLTLPTSRDVITLVARIRLAIPGRKLELPWAVKVNPGYPVVFTLSSIP